jgi:thioesterase domain-containing protein
MKHKTWANNMKRVLSLHRQGKTEKALSMLDTIIDQTTRIADQAISPWHEQQAAGVKSMILKEAGRIKDAAYAELEVVELNQLQLEYWGRALANSLAMAASLHFEAGENRRAAKLAREATQRANQFKESNSIITEAKAKLRNYGKKKTISQKQKRRTHNNRLDSDRK